MREKNGVFRVFSVYLRSTTQSIEHVEENEAGEGHCRVPSGDPVRGHLKNESIFFTTNPTRFDDESSKKEKNKKQKIGANLILTNLDEQEPGPG